MGYVDRDENPWVTVEPNGAVRVKKKWDYEELGKMITIIQNNNINNNNNNNNNVINNDYNKN